VRASLAIGLAVAASIVAPAAAEQDDDEGAAGAGSGLVAPKDPRARPAWLRGKLDAAIAARPALAKAKIAIAVVDLGGGGGELYAKHADVAQNLASNAKLFTSVAALATLGSGFRWRTAIYADKLDDATGAVAGDLYVRGRGDPTLSAQGVAALADDVVARGVRSVSGRLVVDASYFDDVVEPPHYDEQPNERAGFRAPVAALGVAKNAVTVVVVPEPGGGAKVRLEPASEYVKLGKTEVATVVDGATKIAVVAKPARDHLTIDVTGQIRAQDGSFEKRLRVDDPTRFAGEVVRRALADRGVTFKQKAVATGTVPQTAVLVAAHDSAPLALVVRDMDKQSDNYAAECVLKTLGAETRATPGPATWADGTAAVRAYLQTIGVTGARADNGSGLFGASAATARQLVAVLRAAHADYRIGPDLVAALPIAGVDGTLAKRWHGHVAAGRVRAKTGTLDRTITLAGYAGWQDGKTLAFAVLVDAIPGGQRGAARALGDDIVDALVAYLAP
jgi:D-alanyl-D-alanine carboxypeptidase/D-alanyl-D-alanine-endopeptidase (penicillin-binding protein 4)